MKIEIYNKLINEIKVKPFDQKLPSKFKQNFECCLCNKTYITSATIRLRLFKKYKSEGCPSCSFNRVLMRNRNNNLDIISSSFDILTNNPLSLSKKDIIKVKNKKCGHEFESILGYLVYDNVKCPTCWKINNKQAQFLTKSGEIIKKQRWSIEQFCEKLLERNKKYDRIICLNPEKYVGTLVSKLKFKCLKGHIFETKPTYLLNACSGCPKCAIEEAAFKFNLKYSKKALNWLSYIAIRDNIYIQHAQNSGEHVIHHPSGKYFYADGYCKETNTIYEFYGSVFHGDPELFNADDKIHPYRVEITAKQLYEHTIERENLIKNLNYNLITIWEKDWDILNEKLSSAID